MPKKRALFVCIHNSARSQMGEEILRKLAGDRFEVESAGIDPGMLNPFAVKVLKELDIHIDGKKTQSVQELINRGRQYDYVFTVCDETNAERCPIIPGKHQKIHWNFEDPSALAGGDEERLRQTRVIRDQIFERVRHWLHSEGITINQ